MHINKSIALLDALNREIGDINALVGNVCAPTRETFEHQLKIILSEVSELETGLIEGRRDQIRDGIADVLFTLIGMLARMGYLEYSADSAAQSAYCDRVTEDGSLAELIYFLRKIEKTSQKVKSDELNHAAINAEITAFIGGVIRIALSHDIDWLYDLRSVVDSQWSKFDRSEADAIITALKYQAAGLKTKYEPKEWNGVTYYVTYSAADQPDVKGRPIPKGKWLKSCRFQDVDFRFDGNQSLRNTLRECFDQNHESLNPTDVLLDVCGFDEVTALHLDRKSVV